MLWSIDSCQNRVSADQYHLTVSRAQVSTHRGRVFFEVIRWQVTSFQMIAGSSLIFLIHMKYVVFMCRSIKKLLISNWPRTRKFSQLLQAGKTVAFDFFQHGHALVILYVQILCSDWSKFDRWVHAQKIYAASWNLFTLTAEAERVYVNLWCLFSTGCAKWNSAAMKSLLSFMASLFIGYLVEKYRRLLKSEIRFRTASFSFFTLLDA